jgi:UDP-N-acetylglucosamine--N-acetylmuramyl-(pentapeptide) pyrophosphoryl-undecaprenol N-acetylglucosamine transferase
VYPALSVLQALQREDEQRKLDGTSPEVLWIGAEGGLEEGLVKREQVPYEAIPAAGVHGVGLRTLPGNLARLGRGLRASRRIMKDFRPDVAFFTGGYVAVPVALAARLVVGQKQRPRTLVYIPDIEPGWALKVLVHMADHVALTVNESQAHLPKYVRRTVTGYPLRKELKTWSPSSARSALQLTGDVPVFLVLGGSRGARSINQALFAALPQLLEKMQILHVSGQQAWEQAASIRKTLPEHLAERYHPYPYLHAEMGAALAVSNLVLSRAGASALGEYPAFGLPALLIPYPYAWRYQRVNANYLAQHGAALVLDDANLITTLAPAVLEVLGDPPRLESMAEAMRCLASPDAAGAIAEIIVSLANPGR